LIALDHVSVAEAPPGLAVTGHRVLLHRCYLEVGHEAEPLLFLRPGDIHEAARLLGREPQPYRGRDGEWLDVELAGPVALTRRVDRDDWPPAGEGRLEVRVRGDAAALLDPLEPLRVTQVIAAGVRVL
jgi:hypothetical protein